MRNNVIPRVVAGAAVFLAALLAAADAAEVRVQDAWIRALPPPIPSGGYFTLHNEGRQGPGFDRGRQPRLRYADAAQIR